VLDVPADDALIQVRLLLIRIVAVLEMVHQVEALDGQAVFMERKVVLEPVLQVYVESIRTRHMRCSHVHKLSELNVTTQAGVLKMLEKTSKKPISQKNGVQTPVF